MLGVAARTRACLRTPVLLSRATPRSRNSVVQYARREYSRSSSNSYNSSTSRALQLPSLLAGATGLALLAAYASQGHDQIHNEAPPSCPSSKSDLIPMSEVAKHNSRTTGVWVVINSEIYDLTSFLDTHPGGSKIILSNAGKDVTDLFTPVHPSNAISESLTPDQFIGHVDPSTVLAPSQKDESPAERRRRVALENLPPVGSMLNLDDFEVKAEEILSDQAWAYFSSAGDDEVTVNENRNAFGRVWFKPRVLRPIGEVDTSVQVVGGSVDSALPIYISPAAMAKLGHPEGELNLTRAAGVSGIIQGVSANASVSLDEILDARTSTQPLIYQLYLNKDRSASERILSKVQSRNCTAVMLTVDAPVMGKRERDMRAKGEVVETGGGAGGSTSGGGVATAISGYIDPNLSWDDVKWYKSKCTLPLFLKGIQTVEDAVLAAEHGVQGIVLSNHGGRSLDFARPALDVLIDIRQQRPDLFEKVEIWLDGGVRRGTDVVKALALGASAVGLGRPFLYAQSGFGQPGAERAIEIMRDEIERAMRLLGVTSIKQLKPEMLEILPRTFVGASTLPPPRQRQ